MHIHSSEGMTGQRPPLSFFISDKEGGRMGTEVGRTATAQNLDDTQVRQRQALLWNAQEASLQ